MNNWKSRETLLIGLAFALSVIFYFHPWPSGTEPDVASASLFLIAEDKFFARAASSPDFKPIRNWDVEEPNLSSSSAFIYLDASEKTLYAKNADDVRPIASLAKILTARITKNIFEAKDEITVSREAIEQEGDSVGFSAGEILYFEDILNAMLIASSNDAAFALLEEGKKKLNGEDFLDWLNNEIKNFGFDVFFLSDPAGLEEKTVGTARALAGFYGIILNDESLKQILGTKDIFIKSADGRFRHHLVNTNDLLWLDDKVKGGKTGYTDEAGGNLIVELEMPNGERGIFVVLGSGDRFDEMEKLIEWTRKAYLWE